MSNENNYVELDSYSAILINQVLNKRFSYFNDDYKKFSLSELASITEITLTGFDSLSLLKYLPNLKSLRLVSADYNKVSSDYTYDSSSFNHISSLELNRYLNSMTGLEKLEIVNDININILDVSGLPNLKELIIDGCPELKQISGLSMLRKLKKVNIIGTNINKNDELIGYLLHTVDSDENLLDISMFLSGVKSIQDIKTLNELKLRGLIKVQFAEKNGIIGSTRLELEQVCELYERFKSLFKQRKLDNLPDYDKVVYVMEYIKRNVSFAADELDERKKFINNIRNADGETPKWADRYLGYLHSSYATFKRKKANCEGMVNLIRFMLGILGIESENVQCNDKRSNYLNTTNHSIIRVLIDGKYYYFDPSYDPKNRSQYYFMGFDEASSYLDLSLYEAIKMEGVKNEQRQLHF